MSASAAGDHSPRPQSKLRSLLQSLSTIQRSPVDDTTPRQASHHCGEDGNHHGVSLNDVIAALQMSRGKRERPGGSQSRNRNSKLPDLRSSLRARRVTVEPLTVRHATKMSPTSANAGMNQPQSQGLSPLPFAGSGVAPEPLRAPSQCRSFVPLTAELTDEMVTRLASERQQRAHREVSRGSEGYDRGFDDAGLEDLATPPSEVRVPVQARQCGGFRRDYLLGDAARCSSHMIVHPSVHGATRAAAFLKNHDFAFVKRSDGSYTYAIVAYRHALCAPEEEDFMVFVIDGAGSTKVVARRHWGTYVRLVSAEGIDPHPHHCKVFAGASPVEVKLDAPVRECPMYFQETTPPVVCQEIEEDEDNLTPPDVIVFSSSRYKNDDCSVISSVSNRAM